MQEIVDIVMCGCILSNFTIQCQDGELLEASDDEEHDSEEEEEERRPDGILRRQQLVISLSN